MKATLDSRAEAHAALIDAVCSAGAEMDWFVSDFRHWPLDDARLLDALRTWALARPPHSRAALRILALDWRPVTGLYPVFTRLRRDLSHVIACRGCAPRQAPDLYDMAWCGGAAVWAPTATWASATRVESAAELARLRWTFDPVWRESAEQFPTDVLGL